MPGSHPGDEWFESPARNHKILGKERRIEAISGISGVMSQAGEFTTGFVGMMGDAVNAFMENRMLMVFLFAIPLSMGAIAFVRGLIKKRKG